MCKIVYFINRLKFICIRLLVETLYGKPTRFIKGYLEKNNIYLKTVGYGAPITPYDIDV